MIESCQQNIQLPPLHSVVSSMHAGAGHLHHPPISPATPSSNKMQVHYALPTSGPS